MSFVLGLVRQRARASQGAKYKARRTKYEVLCQTKSPEYYLQPLSEKKLRGLIKKIGIKPRDLLRSGEPVYRELGLAKGDFSDDKIISLMVTNPDLIQRPIVERGDRAVLGRPTENVKVLLTQKA